MSWNYYSCQFTCYSLLSSLSMCDDECAARENKEWVGRGRGRWWTLISINSDRNNNQNSSMMILEWNIYMWFNDECEWVGVNRMKKSGIQEESRRRRNKRSRMWNNDAYILLYNYVSMFDLPWLHNTMQRYHNIASNDPSRIDSQPFYIDNSIVENILYLLLPFESCYRAHIVDWSLLLSVLSFSCMYVCICIYHSGMCVSHSFSSFHWFEIRVGDFNTFFTFVIYN
jgi:hypothetical protein